MYEHGQATAEPTRCSMYSLGFIFLCASAVVRAGHVPQKPFYELEQAEQHFNEFMATYGREYSSESEKQMRFEIFKETLREINEKNANPKLTAVYDINKFSDLDKVEFLQINTGFVPSNSEIESIEVKGPLSEAVPDSFDWRDHNAVTEVKDQALCGSCYAFSAIGAVEGAYAIKHKQVVSLSEEQILDCDLGAGENVCHGGDMRKAIDYLIKTGGSEAESTYPYTAGDDGYASQCKFDKSKVQTKVAGHKNINVIDEDVLRQVLMKEGPLSIGVDADDMQPYTGGVLNNCKTDDLNHGVLLVGYGTEAGVPYWIIKNSWGTDFGEKGYIRVQRGINACGLTSYITAVDVAA